MVTRVGIVGFGKLGLLHAGMMNGLSGSKLACVVDPSSTSLQMLKSQMPSIEIFESHRQILSGQVDAAFICTPTNLHVNIAKDFIDAKIPVFIEKPLSISFEETKQLTSSLKKQPVVNMVGYMSRYVDTFRKAREIIQSGVLGKIQMVHSNMYIGQLFNKGKGWRYSKKQSGGGVLITQNSHLLDMLVWMFGEVDYVSGHQRSLYSSEVEDWFNGFIAFKSGIGCALDSSWSKRHHRTLSMKIEIQGENGTLSVDEDDLRLFLIEGNQKYPPQWTVFKKPDLYEGVELDIGGAHYCRQAQDFLTAIEKKKSPESDIFSAAYVQCILEGLYQSAEKRGQPVNIDLLRDKK